MDAVLPLDQMTTEEKLRAMEAQIAQAQATYVAAQRKWDSMAEDQGPEKRAAEAQVQQAQADLAAAQRRWSTLDQDQAAELASGRAHLSQAQGALESGAGLWADTIATRLPSACARSAKSMPAPLATQTITASALRAMLFARERFLPVS